MDTEEWFTSFRQSYRKIVDAKFSDRKETFPLYSPVDISVHFIDDPKGIFPEVVVFFSSGFNEEYPASDIIVADTMKIEWPKELQPVRIIEL